MLTLGASLVSWASWVSSWARLVVVLLLLSFSSRSSRWFRVVWKNCFRVGCCYGNGSSSGLPRRGRPLSFEQARGATRRRFTNTRESLASWPSVLLDVAWWDDVMLAILRRESSIHARTFLMFFDRSGAIQRCFRFRPESVSSEMSFFQKGNDVHSFVCSAFVYMQNCFSSAQFTICFLNSHVFRSRC